MSNNPTVIQFFTKNTQYQQDEIADCQLFHDGYTFKSYLLTLKDQQAFQIKLSKSHTPTIVNEGLIYEIYNKAHILYYDAEGNIIKHWIACLENVDHTSPEILKLLFKELKKFHQLPTSISPYQFEYDKYLNNLKLYDLKLHDQYVELLKRHTHDKVVLSHGDVNRGNYLVYAQNGVAKLLLIDFEWCCQNYVWFDYINILCEDEIYDLKVIQTFASELACDTNEIWKLMFIRWCFTLGWALHEKNILPRMEEYILKCEKNLKIIFTKLVL